MEEKEFKFPFKCNLPSSFARIKVPNFSEERLWNKLKRLGTPTFFLPKNGIKSQKKKLG